MNITGYTTKLEGLRPNRVYVIFWPAITEALRATLRSMLHAPRPMLIPLRQHLDAHQPYFLFLELTGKLMYGLFQ